MTYLTRILEAKREEVAFRRRSAPLAQLHGRAEFQAAPRPFVDALRQRPFAVIAELKKASPSQGVIRPDFAVPAIARSYAQGGAAALSILTDEPFFQGRLAYLAEAREAVGLPALRKDFVIDSYQLHESRAWGADAVLLIGAALEPAHAAELAGEACTLGLDVLFEVHSEDEAERALAAGARCIGINNRDLHSFTVDLGTSERVARRLPPEVIAVSESGIRTGADLIRLQQAGIRAALIGETFMRAADPGAALAGLLREAGA